MLEARGYPTGCQAVSHDVVEPPMHRDDDHRVRFIGQPWWVTAFDPDESRAGRDLVAWLTIGHQER